jgi:hypothetical protein
MRKPLAALSVFTGSPRGKSLVMIGEKQGTVTEGLAERFARIVFAELPNRQLLLLSSVAGALWAASLFDWPFVTGHSAFWQFPQGTIRDSGNDMADVLVGYLYYVQSPWHLPLFYVPTLGTPAGVNIIFLDVVPIVPFIGKLIHSLTGVTTNLYGAFLFLCFALPGVMMTLVLIAAKVRYALAAIIAAIFANATPTLLWRWGHVPLEPQFLIVGALALYLFSLHRRSWRSVATVWIAYLILAYLTNLYLFLMTGIIWFCAIIQRRLNRLATTREAQGTAALTVALVTTVITLSGQFGAGTGVPFAHGYGYHSMNLLSPIIPQESGLFPWAGGVIDATGGQYEGFNYLGLGLLLASLVVLPVEVSWLRENLKRHLALFIAFVVLAAFAISHRVFAGHWLLFELPLPHYVYLLFGMFRSSGRFFWPIAYSQMAIVIILGFRRAPRVMALCLVGAAILQLFDVQPLREQIIASVAEGPEVGELDADQIAHLVARARQIEVVPSFQCADLRPGHDLYRANMDLMLAAARANVPTNTVYSGRETYGITLRDLLREPSRAGAMLRARRDDYCNQEIERARSGGRPGDIFVLLSDQPRPDEMVPGVTCSSISWARYCIHSVL